MCQPRNDSGTMAMETPGMDGHAGATRALSYDGRTPIGETVATRTADREGYAIAMDEWDAPTLRNAR